jgi:hypothetical protein
MPIFIQGLSPDDVLALPSGHLEMLVLTDKLLVLSSLVS